MGFRESLMNDFRDKTIEYQGKRLYIAEQFTYGDVEYLCGCDIDSINRIRNKESSDMEMMFLHKNQNNLFEWVSNKELFDELVLYVSGVLIGKKLEALISE